MCKGEAIIEAAVTLAESRSPEPILFIHYGSNLFKSESNHDFDFLLVTEGQQAKQVIEENFVFGKVDVIRETYHAFQEYLEIKDPIYGTEPVLTGKALLDPQNKFESIKQVLKGDDGSSPHYLFKQHLDESWKAHKKVQQGDLKSVLKSLEFGISYYLFSQWYRNNDKPITWRDLKQKLTQEFRELIKTVERFQDQLKENNKKDTKEGLEKDVKGLVEDWEVILMKESFTEFR